MLGVKETESIVEAIMISTPVQHCWRIMSVDIDDAISSDQLLRDIVTLWTTIRGFSIASSWMKIYKEEKRKVTQKSKSLRRTLLKTNRTD